MAVIINELEMAPAPAAQPDRGNAHRQIAGAGQRLCPIWPEKSKRIFRGNKIASID